MITCLGLRTEPAGAAQTLLILEAHIVILAPGQTNLRYSRLNRVSHLNCTS
jgi:hypothetical protein